MRDSVNDRIEPILNRAKELANNAVGMGPEALGVAGGGVAGGVASAGVGAVAGFAVAGPGGAAIGFVAGFTVGTLGGATGGYKFAKWLKKAGHDEQESSEAI